MYLIFWGWQFHFRWGKSITEVVRLISFPRKWTTSFWRSRSVLFLKEFISSRKLKGTINRRWQYNNNHFSYMFDILPFQMHFLLQKLLYFDSKLTEFGPINRKSAWIQVMVCYCTGCKPLPGPTIWVKSRNYGCLITCICYPLIAKTGNKTVAVSWPDPYPVQWGIYVLPGLKGFRGNCGVLLEAWRVILGLNSSQTTIRSTSLG